MTQTEQIQPIITNSTATTNLNEQQRILTRRLQEAGVSTKCFLKTGYQGCDVEGDKKAFEKEWPNKLYGAEDLETYPRWGICGRSPLVPIDSDDPVIYDVLSRVLPETFEVTSPRRGLPHKYFIVEGPQVPNKLHYPEIFDEKGNLKDLGEIRANNQYLVAPGTTIRYIDKQTGEQKTGMYTITKDVPIARMTYHDFMTAIKTYITEANGSTTQTITQKEMTEGVTEGARHTKAVSYAGKLVHRLKFDYETALIHLKTWNNSLCKPPLPDEEITRILKDVYGYAAKEKGVSYEEALKGENEQSFSEQILQIEAEATATIKEDSVTLDHINDIENPEYAGKPIIVEAVISSNSLSYTIPSEVEAIIKEEDTDETREENKSIKINDPLNLNFITVTTDQQKRQL